MAKNLPSLACCLLAGICCWLSAFSQNPSSPRLLDPVVRTKNGLVKGILNEPHSVVIFKGIPFAAPPVGDLRWRAPQPATSWSGVRDASKFCSSCMQKRLYSHLPRGPWTEEFMVQDSVSEDCLYLNIWTPAKAAKDNLPVLVFFHGGGFNEGSGSIKAYDGEELAKKGIIVITINYRLGVLGFLAHPELTAESPARASGNYGVLDCLAAVQWVKANIAAFGGNPAKITIAGQSAGAAAVHRLTTSPLAKGLFSGAIAESGSNLTRLNRTASLAEAEQVGLDFMGAKGAKSLAALRQLTAQDLIAPVKSSRPLQFGVIQDGFVLTEPMGSTFEKGRQNDVPTLTGITADDAASPRTKVAQSAFVDNARKQYGENGSGFLSLYPAQTDEQASAAFVESARDQNKVATYKWAAFRAKTAKTPVYTYYFDQAIPWPEHPEFGAFHTGDVPYFFNNLKVLNRPWTAVDRTVAETASSYWVNFVKTGNPNGPGLPPWSAFDPSKPETLHLGKPIGMMPITSDEKLKFFVNY